MADSNRGRWSPRQTGLAAIIGAVIGRLQDMCDWLREGAELRNPAISKMVADGICEIGNALSRACWHAERT